MIYKLFAGVLVLFCVLTLGYWYDSTQTISPITPIPEAISSAGYKNSTYRIDGVEFILKNGESSVPAAPGSATRIVTRYFGNEAIGDLNNDGVDDVVFLLTQETGGTGVFYYVVAALTIGTGYLGSDAFLIGDRIAPRGVRITDENLVTVTYADRREGEAFAVPPSVGKSMMLKFNAPTMQFEVPNSEDMGM